MTFILTVNFQFKIKLNVPWNFIERFPVAKKNGILNAIERNKNFYDFPEMNLLV